MDYESDNYRQIPKSKVIDVPDTPAFGEWRSLFSPKAVSHPAKMNQNLLRHLLEKYTVPGEVVLDPMSGTGATGVQAALLGRHGVCVEYEKWMVDIARETVDRVGKHSQLTPKGTMTMIHGDARELSRVVRSAPVDAAVFSPPHGNTMNQPTGVHPNADEGRLRKWWENYRSQGGGMGFEAFVRYQREQSYQYDSVITSPPHGDTRGDRNRATTPEHLAERLRKAGYSEDYIRNYITLNPTDEKMKGIGIVDSYDKFDAVVTSPPHSDTPISSQGADGDKQEWNRAYKKYRKTGDPTAFAEQMNRQRKSAGYDAVVTSPPHGGTLHPTGQDDAQERIRAKGGQPGGGQLAYDQEYSRDSENLGNKPYGDIDTIITSPPYDQALGDKAHSPVADRIFREKGLGVYTERGRGEGNIGNLTGGNIDAIVTSPPYEEGRKSGETYLEAMFRVYKELFKVLKPGGTIIVVVKNFVRSSKPVRLDVDTCKLLRAAGFEEVDHLYRRLRTVSFWIRNGIRQFRKRQHDGKIPKDWPLPYTKFEDCLIWKKPA